MEMNERLKYLRKGLSLSQVEFTEPLGMSQVALSHYENGDRQIPDVFIKTLCQTYHISETWFRTGEGEPYVEEDTEQILSSVFRERLPDMDEQYRTALMAALADLDADGWKKLIDAAKVIAGLLPDDKPK